jgi:hypothetical protein
VYITGGRTFGLNLVQSLTYYLFENGISKYKYWRGTEIRNKCSLDFVPLSALNNKLALSALFCCIIPKNKNKKFWEELIYLLSQHKTLF